MNYEFHALARPSDASQLMQRLENNRFYSALWRNLKPVALTGYRLFIAG